MNSKIILSSLLLLVGLLQACSTAPVTGRTRIKLAPDAVVESESEQGFASILSQVNSQNAALTGKESAQAKEIFDMVNRVANKIIDAAGLRSRYNWEILIVKTREKNAFAMASGKIVVYTGILEVTQTEAGLAAVLGHEVAHVVAKHRAERLAQSTFAQTALTAADLALLVKRADNRVSVGRALAYEVKYGILLPFNREHESEADRIGQIYMARAGYDPAQAPAVWERMMQLAPTRVEEYYSTHPSHETRISQLTEWQPQANAYYTDPTRPVPKNLDDIRFAEKVNLSRAYSGPLGYKPEFKEGHWYKTKATGGNEITYKYERPFACGSEKCIVISSSIRGRRTLTPDYSIIKDESVDGSWTYFDPPLQLIRFPVRPGDNWEAPTNVETSDGNVNTVVYKTQVVAYEYITVPGGTFLGYRTITSSGGKRYFEGWYVPEVRAFVRSITYDAKGQERQTVLTDYYKASPFAQEPSKVDAGKTQTQVPPKPPTKSQR